MNRDEQRERVESKNIYAENNLYYPVDKKSGGTWFGFNQHGIVMALLNRYQDTSITSTCNTTSRGAIIPLLLTYQQIQQVNSALLSLPLSEVKPFDLVVNSNHTIMKYSWNGTDLNRQKYKSPFFLSSSSVDAKTVLPYRKQKNITFLSKQNKVKAENILLNLHLSQDKKDTSSSILMSRRLTHTKSISQVIIKDNELNYQYIDEKKLACINIKKPYLKGENLQIKIT